MANIEQAKEIQGFDVLVFMRALKDAKTMQGRLVPFQTSEKFTQKNETNETKTKTGTVNASSGLSTEFELEMTNNNSQIADVLRDSVRSGETLEVWRVYRNTENEKGQKLAWYFRVKVTEDAEENPTDDVSNRSLSFSVIGTPVRDYLTLSNEQIEAVNYAFRDMEKDTNTNTNGK